jgi:hypothetical protein
MKKFIVQHTPLFILVFTAAMYLAGCQTMQSAYYKTMETFGHQKRDLMVSKVKDARDSQEEVKAKFQVAMEQFSTVLNSDKGKLGEKNKLLKSEYKKSKKKAKTIRKNIDSVEKVSDALFTEWEAELDQYTSDSLRSGSEQRMREARDQKIHFIDAMKRAEEKVVPVLSAFNDLVLFSRHNLNAETIESVKGELISAEEGVASLIKEIEASINEADALIKLMSNE